MFVAIIILLVMTLAGVAMMRQMRSDLSIAGNLAFKQNATSVGDLGTEVALAWLTTQNSVALQADQGALGYQSSFGAGVDPAAFDWSDATSRLATADDGTGNEVRYIVHRLCKTAGLAADNPAQECVTVEGDAAGATKGGGHYGSLPLSTSIQPYFRVTTRVVGPRNTVSYVQVVVK